MVKRRYRSNDSLLRTVFQIYRCPKRLSVVTFDSHHIGAQFSVMVATLTLSLRTIPIDVP